MNGKVECPNCQNLVTPKLWLHDTKSLLVKRKNEHICPVCGETMYISGGGHTGLGKIVFFIILVPIAFLFLAKIFTIPFAYLGFGSISPWLGLVSFAALVYYLYKRKNKT